MLIPVRRLPDMEVGVVAKDCDELFLPEDCLDETITIRRGMIIHKDRNKGVECVLAFYKTSIGVNILSRFRLVYLLDGEWHLSHGCASHQCVTAILDAISNIIGEESP